MARTKITSNVLAPSAAQTNINDDGSFTLSVPTQINNTLTTNNKVTIDSTSAVANPKLLIVSTTSVGTGENSPLVIRGSGINKIASINLRSTGGSGELYDAWVLGKVGGGIQVNNSFTVSGGGTGPASGSVTFSVLSTGNVGIGTATPNEKLHIYDSVDAHLKIAGADTAGSIRKLSLERSTGGAEIHFNEDTRITQGLTLNTTNAAYPMSFQINGDTKMFVSTAGSVGIGTTTPTEKLTVSGNISASGNVTASNLVYTTSDQTIAGVKTFSDNIVGNGTANRLPNQLAVASSDIIIKGLADSRYTSRNKRITDDTTFVQTTWEQFLDFDDQYNQDLNVVTAFGAGTFAVSPGVFGDVWTTGNAGVAAFSGNDAHTHRGIFLVRGPTSNNAAFYMGIARTTIPYNLTNRIDEFTCRVFVGSNDFTTQGYFKIGPIPKGGTGTSDTSLRAGLIFNPYFHATNLVLGAYKSTTISPFTFTTNPLSADFLDTGVNFIDLMDKWVNITYKIDRSVGPTVTVIITRENAVLFQASYNVATHPVVSTWARRSELYTTGASNEIGIQSGKFTYTTRSQIHIDYLHYKVTGTSAAPSNWNSLRF